MTRYFALGNGRMLVDLDGVGQVRDLYYPYVGQENHVNGKEHRIGLWVDGHFSWFNSNEWERQLSYEPDSMVTNIIGVNSARNITMHFQDAVHGEHNIFIRAITIHNRSDRQRKIRLFLHQRFECYESNIGDTVYYHPSLDAIIHYKGKRYFLINGRHKNRTFHGMSEYATGLAHEYGLEGTYKDAEDGHLSGNPIEHGSVDSTIAFHITLPPNKSKTIHYWVCVGKNFYEVADLNRIIKKEGPQVLLTETENYWRDWANRTPFNFMGLSDRVVDLFKRSLLFVRAHVDEGGSIIASSDSEMLFLRRDSYAYMWPRDGALISRSLDRAGYSDITERFFDFCSKVITPDGYLFHKYRPDGSLGSTWHPWIHKGHTQLPFQEDQIWLVLDALWKHFERHRRCDKVSAMFEPFIRKIGDFMLSFMDKKTGLPYESYDIWEEKLGIFTFSCAAVYAGLQAAGHFELTLGSKHRAPRYYNAADKVKKAILDNLYDPHEKRFIKGLYHENGGLKKDMTNDASSAYGVFHFNVLDVYDERIQSSFDFFKQRLHVPTQVGGYARYEGDHYYRVDESLPGNPWIITSLWLAEYYIELAKDMDQLAPAIAIFDWVVAHALPTGALPEQLNPHTGQPLSVTPLTWSHAAFVIAVNKYLEKLDDLGICKMCSPPKQSS